MQIVWGYVMVTDLILLCAGQTSGSQWRYWRG